MFKGAVRVEEPPPGLSVDQLDPDVVAAAVREVQQLLDHELRGQVASNQHAFINLPFPLTALNQREAATPTFSFGDVRVAALERCVRLATATLPADMLERANVIVREYRPGQGIAFHVDELECEGVVVGVALLNECSDHRGLCFTRGAGKGMQLYVLHEHPGTSFAMRDESRYSWRHGLPPVSARRISVTIRFFKRDVVRAWAAAGAPVFTAPAREATVAAATRTGRMRVMLVDNRSLSTRKPAVLEASSLSLRALQQLFKQKLRLKASTIYTADGVALCDDDASMLRVSEGALLYGSRGEAFSAAPKELESASTSAGAASLADALQRQIEVWEGWRYPRLVFFTESMPSAELERRAMSTDELGQLIADSALSVPETRELVQALAPHVEREAEWGFASELTEESRACTVAVIRDTVATCFTVEGAPALKGTRKADGPLWALKGGLNNAHDADPNFSVAADASSSKATKTAVARGAWDDEHDGLIGKRTGGGGGSAKGSKNAYQSKRGVVVTAALVGFGGSVWCSSYFLCPVHLDSETFSSSAHAVMVTQARLFGDHERAEELRRLGDDSAPHRAFDHKAPKNNRRHVANFDGAVWESMRRRLMFRATYAKFEQNESLRQRMRAVFPRVYVEATSDPAWGCGILLSHPDWQKRKRWTANNVMGDILTAVSRLLHWREVAPDAALRLRQLVACEEFALLPDWRRSLSECAAAACTQGDAFPPPHWPGAAAVQAMAAVVATANAPEDLLQLHAESAVWCVECVLGMTFY